MGTGTSSTNTPKRVSSKPPRCSLCKKPYTPMCDFMQGRCPHHPALLDCVLSKEVKTRFQNILKFFKGKK
jgi:hypothetical protein